MIREFGLIDVMYLIAAARWTLALTATAFIGASLIGIVIAIARILPFAPLRWLAAAYIHIVQGTPLLVWLFVIFFGLPLVGISVNPWLAAATAFSVYGSAFLGEIWRGCIEAVPRGQWEAAQALNLSYINRMRFVVLPQAFKIALPPTVGYMVQIIKGTSLAAIIGFTEITRAGQIINNATFQPLHVFTTVAALYFVICWPLSLLAARMERKRALALAR